MTTKHTSRILAIVPVEALENARLYTNALDDAGGEREFVACLSADGQEPATHAWRSGVHTESERKSYTLLLQNVKDARIFDGLKVTAAEALAECGLRVIVPVLAHADTKGGGK